MQTRFIFRFAMLCVFLAGAAGPAAPTAFAQKDQRERDRVSKEDRNRGPSQSKKEGRGGSGAPNKSRGRDEGGNTRKSGR